MCIRDSRGDHVAGGGQLLTVLALVGGLRDGLKAVSCAGACFTTDQNDFCIVAADLAPVGDFAGVDGSNLVDRQIGDGVFGVYDDGDAVECNRGADKTGSLFLVLQRAAGKTDVTAPLRDCLLYTSRCV